MPLTTKIMIVEDHPEYRDLIETVLSEESDLSLISKFGAAEIALRSLQSMATRQIPDLLLLDLNLPGLSGLEAMPFFQHVMPEAKIIVLTQSDRTSDIFTAISRGANGYLLKSASLDEILEGIRTVIQGGAPIDPNVAQCILSYLQKQTPKIPPDQKLSPREMEVLQQLAEGLPKKQIADELNISVNTVSIHVTHIYKKLNVANAPAAISKAYQLGILPAE